MDTSLSIKKELEFLHPFAGQWFHFPRPKDYYTNSSYRPKARNYTEQEIQETEKRLQFKLATPIRELYLYMADVIIADGLVPLELLRWDRDYLAIFITPGDSWANGLYRFDDPNQMYVWEDEWPEDWPEYCDDLMESQDRFEHCCKLGDEAGKKAALKDYYHYLKQVDYGDATKPKSLMKLTGKTRMNHGLDAYGLFMVTQSIKDTMLAIHSKLEDKDIIFFSESVPTTPKEEEPIRKRIEQYFIPISEHPELIEDDTSTFARAYITSDKFALLLKWYDSSNFTLIPKEPVTMEFVEEFEKKLGISFRFGRGGKT